jgi:hypothetical protein
LSIWGYAGKLVDMGQSAKRDSDVLFFFTFSVPFWQLRTAVQNEKF